MCSILAEDFKLSHETYNENVAAIFTIMDTDKNGVIDALEFFACISVLSGMRTREIFEFILTSYDFNDSETLCMDDVALAIKATVMGLSKLSDKQSPREELIEALVYQVSSLEDQGLTCLTAYIPGCNLANVMLM